MVLILSRAGKVTPLWGALKTLVLIRYFRPRLYLYVKKIFFLLFFLFPCRDRHFFAQVVGSFDPKGPRPFPWTEITNHNTWSSFVHNWYGNPNEMIKTVRDSILKKVEIVRTYSREMGKYQLPDSGIFCEYQDLPRKHRAIALHVQNPKVYCYLEPVELGCGGGVSGFCWLEGESSLLLLDTKRKKILQKIADFKVGGDSFGIPAPILSEAWGAYHCSRNKTEDNYNDWGLSTLLYPRDIDGDGLAAEFLFYIYEACNVYNCSILMYDTASDNLFFPSFYLNTIGRDTQFSETVQAILDFPTTSIKNGRIQFTKDVGHGSDVLFYYDLFYNRKRRRFEGVLKEKPYKE